MRFSDAYKGMTRLFAAQIADVGMSAYYVVYIIVMIQLSREDSAAQIVVGTLGLLGLVLLRLGIFVLRFMGLMQAKKDEKGFFSALCMACVTIALSAIQLLVSSEHDRISGWLNVVGTVCFLVSIEFILISIHNLGKKLHCPSVVFVSSRIQLLMVILYTFIILIDIYRNTPNMSEQVASVIRSVLEFVASFMVAIHFGKARKMLSQPEDADHEDVNA